MTELIALDHKTVLASLERRKTVAGLVYRSLAVSGVLLSCVELGYLAFREYREKQYRTELRASADALRHELDRAHATADSLSALLYSLRQVARQDSAAVRRLRESDPQTVHASPRGFACGVSRIVERNGYTALSDRCTLTVTIPRGGSVSGASLAYFGDMHRWKQDSATNPLVDPNAVEPGDTYAFTLP